MSRARAGRRQEQPDRIRFRPHGAIAIAALVALIGAVPLASAGWYYLPILLIPAVIVAWALRAGTDATPAGVRVRALLGERRIAWSEISELGADRRGRALARLTDGQVVPLTAVRDRDLPRLAELGSPDDADPGGPREADPADTGDG